MGKLFEIINSDFCFNGNSISEKDAKERLLSDPQFIFKIKDPSEELITFAIRINPEIIKNFRDISQDILIEHVKNDPCVLLFIEPNQELEWAAIKSDVSSIAFINNPTDDMKFYCLNHDPDSIIYMPADEKLIEMIYTKIENLKSAYRCFDYTSSDMIKIYLKMKFGI